MLAFLDYLLILCHQLAAGFHYITWTDYYVGGPITWADLFFSIFNVVGGITLYCSLYIRWAMLLYIMLHQIRGHAFYYILL